MNIELLIACCALTISLAAGLVAPLIELFREKKKRKFEVLWEATRSFLMINSEPIQDENPASYQNRVAELKGKGLILMTNFYKDEERQVISHYVDCAIKQMRAAKDSKKYAGKTANEWGNDKDIASKAVIQLINQQLR